MIDEQLEFRITQYLDGALPAGEHAALLAEVSANPAAQRVMDEYRKLGDALASLPPMPAVDWDQLQQRISATVAANATSAGTLRLQTNSRRAGVAISTREASYRMPWVRMGAWAAMAACVVIAVGVAFQLTRHGSPQQPTQLPSGNAVAVVHVVGPQIEVASGPAVEQVSIGPPPALAKASGVGFYDEGIVSAPAQVVIASGPDAVQDIDSLY